MKLALALVVSLALLQPTAPAQSIRGGSSSSSAGKAAPPLPAPWKAAAVSNKITPGKPMWMAGYAGRNKPSEGAAQDLFAKTLVIEDSGGARIAIVTLDLIGVPRTMRLAIAGKAQTQHGLPPSHLVLNASHTHCGPELRATRIPPSDEMNQHAEAAEAYTKELEDTIVRSIGSCIAKLSPASVAFSRARCGFAMNRRTPDGKGGWNNFPNPEGPVDHDVPVMRVADAEGREIAIMFGYNCHNTTLGFYQFCGDYAGYAQEYLEKDHPGAVAMFVNGASGDQNPYPRGTLDLAQIHGRSLAAAVEAALTTQITPLSGALSASYKEITLNYEKPPTRDELEAQKKAAGSDKYALGYANRLLGILAERGSLPTEYPYPVQILRLGPDFTMVTLGGEVVVDYSLRLKREIKDKIVWLAGYSNDVMAYIPSLRIWQEGGYEGGGAMRYGSHPSRWNEKVEEQIVSTVHEMRKALP